MVGGTAARMVASWADLRALWMVAPLVSRSAVEMVAKWVDQLDYREAALMAASKAATTV